MVSQEKGLTNLLMALSMQLWYPMSFAAIENIMYVSQGGLEVALLRAFTAIPAHATCGIIMGYYMGKAKFSKNKIKWNLIGLSLAILFHGIYGFFLFINFIPGISIGAFISLIIGIVLSKRFVFILPKFVLGNNEKLQIELQELKGIRAVILKTGL